MGVLPLLDLLYPLGYNVSMDIKNTVKLYATPDGKVPFIEWLESLDKQVRYRVKERLDRVALGNMGDHRAIDQGIWELRLTFGAGYRIYYAHEENSIILLLCAGDKSSQRKDIKKAIAYLQNYLEE
jgi:putative addiction module killer protein